MVDSIGWKPPSDKEGQLTLSIAAHTFPGNHSFSQKTEMLFCALQIIRSEKTRSML